MLLSGARVLEFAAIRLDNLFTDESRKLSMRHRRCRRSVDIAPLLLEPLVEVLEIPFRFELKCQPHEKQVASSTLFLRCCPKSILLGQWGFASGLFYAALCMSGHNVTLRKLEHEPSYRHRHGAICRGAVAELAGTDRDIIRGVDVATPALNRAAAQHRAGVFVAGGNSDRVGDVRERNRNGTVGRGAIAELAVAVATPALNRAVAQNRAAEHQAGSNSDRVRDTGNRDRRRATIGRTSKVRRTTAELALLAISPALNRAALQHRAGVLATSGNNDRVGDVRDRNRNGTVGRGAIAELAVAVATPALNRAVAQNRAGVLVARGNIDGVRDAGNRDRNGTVGRAAVAELTVFVASPALNRAAT